MRVQPTFLAVMLAIGLLLPCHADGALIAEYVFDGDALDTSGAGKHATVNGAILANDRFDRADHAYQFDGINDFVQTPLGSNFKPLSFSVWFYADAASGERSIVDSDVAGRWGHSLIIGYAPAGAGDGTIDVQYHNGAHDSEQAIAAGAWYHAVVTYGDRTKLYLNRFDAVTPSFTAVVDQPYVGTVFDGTNFRLGQHNVNDPQRFVGRIDDVRFYDHVLSVSEVQTLYEQVPEPTSLALFSLASVALLRRRGA